MAYIACLLCLLSRLLACLLACLLKLCPFTLIFNNYQSIVITGINKDDNKKIYDQLIKKYLPNTIILMINEKTNIISKNNFLNQIEIKSESSIYLCKNNTCSLPSKNLEEILKMI